MTIVKTYHARSKVLFFRIQQACVSRRITDYQNMKAVSKICITDENNVNFDVIKKKKRLIEFKSNLCFLFTEYNYNKDECGPKRHRLVQLNIL